MNVRQSARSRDRNVRHRNVRHRNVRHRNVRHRAVEGSKTPRRRQSD